jgi:hypothetical protein
MMGKKLDAGIVIHCERMEKPSQRVSFSAEVRRRRLSQIWYAVTIVVCCWVPRMGVVVAEDVCDSSSEVYPNPEGGGDSSQDTSSNSCRLYMAPTTVGGIEGNYGIFTSVDLDSGDTVLANDGPNIPVLSDDRKESNAFPNTHHLGLFNNVWWGINAIVTDQMRSGEFDYRDRNIVDMVDLQINFGALPNCHPYMPNLQTLMPADGIDYDDRRHLTGDHAKNPLRGSFSYYTGKHFSVDRPVEAGTELFLDYASDWKQHGFPRRQDYYSAAAIVRKWILAIVEKVNNDESLNGKDPDTVFPPEVLVDGAKALLELIRVSAPDFPLDWYGEESIHERSTINKGVYEVEELTSRILSVLPQTPDEWNEVYDESWEFFFERKEELGFSPEEHKPNFPSIKDVADAMYEVSRPPPKTSQELEETGICLDHIVAGRSLAPLEVETVSGTPVDNHNMTIGRGAIAARFLTKGELVVPVPFLHLLDRALFEQLPKEAMAPGDASFSEMILNYCFGHSESTMVMCPVTNAVLVNHCSDRNGRFQCGGGMGPNAEYRWASESEWDRKTKTTLAMTLDDLAGSNYKQQHRMMSMEIVATRDIQEGEEVSQEESQNPRPLEYYFELNYFHCARAHNTKFFSVFRFLSTTEKNGKRRG